MKVKIKGLGVTLYYPFGDKGPHRSLRQYVFEAEDGRIDIIEEWDEPEMPDGVYNFSKETVDNIFASVPQHELREDEW